VSSEQSPGFNGPGTFKSQAIASDWGPADFYAMTEDDFKENVEAHFRWRKGSKNHSFFSHFISFMSSLAFALVLACKKRKIKKKQVTISVLDIYTLQKEILVSQALYLIQAYNITDSKFKIDPVLSSWCGTKSKQR
jgi:hypothetical protein